MQLANGTDKYRCISLQLPTSFNINTLTGGSGLLCWLVDGQTIMLTSTCSLSKLRADKSVSIETMSDADMLAGTVLWNMKKSHNSRGHNCIHINTDYIICLMSRSSELLFQQLVPLLMPKNLLHALVCTKIGLCKVQNNYSHTD